MNIINLVKINHRFGSACSLTMAVGSLLLASAGHAQVAPSPVRDVDNPARQPFHMQLVNQTVAENDAPLIRLVDVPVGKRLVIEHITIRILASPSPERQSLVLAELLSQINGAAAEHALALDKVPELPAETAEVFQTNQPMRVYADPGTTVSLRVQYSSGSGFDDLATAIVNRFSLSGYFVDLN